MRAKTVSTLIICLLSLAVVAQRRVSGVVISAEDSAAVSNAGVYLDGGNMNVTSGSRGRFAFDRIENGPHKLSVVHEDFRSKQIEFVVGGADVIITVFPPFFMNSIAASIFGPFEPSGKCFSFLYNEAFFIGSFLSCF